MGAINSIHVKNPGAPQLLIFCDIISLQQNALLSLFISVRYSCLHSFQPCCKVLNKDVKNKCTKSLHFNKIEREAEHNMHYAMQRGCRHKCIRLACRYLLRLPWYAAALFYKVMIGENISMRSLSS